MSPDTRRRVGTLLLATYVVVVGVSGFAWPLGHGDVAVWLLTRSWFMFHREDGYNYHLRFAVMFPDGRRDEADVDRWFAWPASQTTRRYDELSRDTATLRALVRFLCGRHNHDARSNERWIAITVTDTAWPAKRGRRVSLAETPWPEQRVTEYLHDEPCP